MRPPDYARENVKLYLGDALEILPELEGVDAVVTDPNYGIDACNRARILSREKLAPARDYGEKNWDSEPASPEAISLIRKVAPVQIIWGGNYFDLPPCSGPLIWDKLNSGDFADGELAWNNLEIALRIFRHRWNGMIRDGEEKGVPRVHETQKPVALMSWCLDQAKVQPGQTVVDPYLGSGSTIIACIRKGISAVGIELDPAHFETARARIDAELDSPMLPGVAPEPLPEQAEFLTGSDSP